jgi:putative transposase
MSTDDLYQEKYKIKSLRKINYNYSSIGSYFITICTQNKHKYFGNIMNCEMKLNDIGQIASKFWLEIPKHFSNVMLDEFIVMPDHIHGIIIIVKPVETLHRNVSTRQINQPRNQFMSKISPKPNSLSTIIRSYKSACTREINKYHSSIKFSWQSRYYDRIIRNHYEFLNVQKYIYNNPVNWEPDKRNM